MTYNAYVKLLPTYEFDGLTEAQFKRLNEEFTNIECQKDFFKGGVENHLSVYGGCRRTKGIYYLCLSLEGDTGYKKFFPSNRDLSDPEYEKLIVEMDELADRFKALIEQEEP